MHSLYRACLLGFAAPLALIACQPTATQVSDSGLDLNFEKITLDNGLEVVFHVDRSDPVVAINLAAHVG